MRPEDHADQAFRFAQIGDSIVELKARVVAEVRKAVEEERQGCLEILEMRAMALPGQTRKELKAAIAAIKERGGRKQIKL